MAHELIAHAISAVAGAVPSIGALIASVRKKGREIAELKTEVQVERTKRIALAKELTELKDGFDARIRVAVRNAINRASRNELDSSKQLVDDAREDMAAHIERIDEELARVRTLAEAAAPAARFNEHVKTEADKWTDVHRALGQIEGMLEGVRDRIRGK